MCYLHFQAREEYDDALSSGQQAFLLEESEQSPDIFSLSVGSLPPGESASIRLEYVTELAVQADDGLRFCLPAVLNPRYEPLGRKCRNATKTWTSSPVFFIVTCSWFSMNEIVFGFVFLICNHIPCLTQVLV